MRLLHAFEKGSPPRTPQDHSLATLAPKIELEDCEIKSDRPAKELHNLVRGSIPTPGPGAMSWPREKKNELKISRSRVVPCEKAIPGTILNADQTKGNLLVAAGDNALELLEVHLEGKKSMTSEDLARGIPRSQLIFKV